jgi:hypothetical protein
VLLYYPDRLARTFPTQEHDLLVFEGIGGFEKLFQFLDRSRGRGMWTFTSGGNRNPFQSAVSKLDFISR